MSSAWWTPFVGDIFAWWGMVVLIGLLSVPFVFRSLFLLPDRGWAVSKLFGLVVWALAAAWMGTLPSVASHGFRWVLGGAFAVLVFIHVVLAPGTYPEIGRFVRERWRELIVQEVVFLGVLLLYLAFRSYIPDATFDSTWAGAEKWPNLAVLTRLWRSPAIPPEDPWLAGFPINYYYFNHWMWACLARATHVVPSVAFNLALGTSFALLALAAFGIGRAASERVVGGLWAVFFLALMGTPATWTQVPKLLEAARLHGIGALPRLFDFWSPSDVVPYTRNEFPCFNWVLGDLHAHAMGLALFLLAVGFLVHLDRRREIEAVGWARLVALEPLSAMGLAIVLGAMWATNGWDLPMIACVGILWILFSTDTSTRSARFAQTVQGLLIWILGLLVAVGIVVAFYSRHTELPLMIRHPEWARLPSPLSALASVGFVAPGERTTLRQFFAIWGFFVGIVAVGEAIRGWMYRKRSEDATIWNAPGLVLFLAGMVVLVWTSRIGVAVAVAMLVGMGFAFCRLSREGLESSERWMWILGATAMVGVLVPECVFVDDPIGPPYDRYNTVFKLGYTAWGCAALACALFLSRLGVLLRETGSPTKRIRFVAIGLGALLVIAGGVYPAMSVWARITDGRERMAILEKTGVDPRAVRRVCRTLDGLAFMALPDYSADDLALGLWMRDRLDATDRVAEMSGESYTMAGRFAAISGNPDMLGWESHEVQWRGPAFQRIYEQRKTDMQTLFESADAEATREVCERLDSKQCSPEALAKIASVGRVAKQCGDAILYEVDLVGSSREIETKKESR
jgi:YYY domain-containing protein